MLYNCPNAEQMKETYQEYLKCFRDHDWEGLKNYVADNIYFYWGVSMEPLVGKDAFVGFFKAASEYWDEKPSAEIIDATVPVLRVWIDNKIKVHKDWNDSPFAAFGMEPKAGDEYNPNGYVNYVFNEDGQIAIIIDNDYEH